MHIESSRQQRLINYWLKLFPWKTADDVFVARGSVIGRNVQVGRGTRFNGPTYIRGLGELRIGNFCAIAHESRLITSNHAIDYMNLQHGLNRQLGLQEKVAAKRGIEIGHNVWLGERVMILPGITVGNGAIVGAGSVVTKDVDRYTIWAGNPARRIRDRFDDAVKEALDCSEWWVWTFGRMRRAAALFDANLSELPVEEALELIRRHVSESLNDVA